MGLRSKATDVAGLATARFVPGRSNFQAPPTLVFESRERERHLLVLEQARRIRFVARIRAGASAQRLLWRRRNFATDRRSETCSFRKVFARHG